MLKKLVRSEQGSNLRYGSVGGAKNYEHPISLARFIMKNTKQILVVGEEADTLAARLDEEEKHDRDQEGEASESDWSLLDDDGFAEKQNCPLDECPNRDAAAIVLPNKPTVTIVLDEDDYEDLEPLELTTHDTTLTFLYSFPPHQLAATFSVAALDHTGNLACATSSFRWADDEPSTRTCINSPRKISDSSSPGGWLSAGATVPGCGLVLEESGCASFSFADDRALFGLAPAHSLLRALSEEMLLPSQEPQSPDGPRSRCSGSSPVGQLLERELEKLPKEVAAGAILLEAERGSVHVRSRGPAKCSFPWAYCADRKMFHGCAPGEARCRRLGEELIPPTPPPSLAGKRDLNERLCKTEAGCPCGSAH
ncbi:hypothetical protein QAD02_020083 [Eretmocerus hayati]|uniref:Uncharacterized protein n=1 Tax=Eretmocerus hayati TaxID=131215 RepID=A0ACC2PLE0_9HYME|nr:hypothetical protein QAD02_020083 [Eretmocerus hayati]